MSSRIYIPIFAAVTLLLLFLISIKSREIISVKPTRESEQDMMQGRDQFDPELIEYIRTVWLKAPSTESRNLEEPDKIHYSEFNQSQVIDLHLNQRSNGFFVECGAFDGETDSNSLFFEKTRNWGGILIEPEPNVYEELVAKNRHAYTINACICPFPKSAIIKYNIGGTLGGITSYMEKSTLVRLLRYAGGNYTINIQCFPLYSVLAAAGVTHVDYLSLDTKGTEIEILKSIPFDKITIDVMNVEMYQPNKSPQVRRIEESTELMRANGYRKINFDGLDIFFERRE